MTQAPIETAVSDTDLPDPGVLDTDIPEAGASDADVPHTDLSAVIGRHVRTFRKQQGLTLRALSERSGLSAGFLSQLERGLTSISLTTLRDLAHCLGHQIVEFFDDTPAHDLPPSTPASAMPSGGLPPRTPSDASSPSAPPRPSTPASATPPSTLSSATPPGAPTPSGPPKSLASSYFTLTRGTGEHTSQYVSGLRTYRLLSQRAPGLVLEPMLVTIEPGGAHDRPEVHDGEEFAYVISGELTFTVDGVPHVLREGDSLHLRSSIPHQLQNDTDGLVVVVSVVTPRLF